MAEKKTGLGGTPLKRRDPGSTRKGRSVVAAAHGSPVTEIKRLRLDEIADNPDNPPTRIADVAELAESMRQVGQLQPGLVIAAEDFITELPQHADAVGDRAWVLLAGHRRRAAAAEAGLEFFEALERSSARMDEAILHENLHREALSPIEEAEAFARVMKRRGLSQRKMAEHAGVSQSHIAKRLRLLDLPPRLQDLITRGELSPAAALEILTQESAATMTEVAARIEEPEALSEPVVNVVAEARRSVERRERIEVARAKAAEEGVEYLESPDARFGARLWEQRLDDARSIQEARERGDLAYAPAGPYTSREPQAYRLSQPEKKSSAGDDPVTAEKKASSRAAKNRAVFLTATAKRKPTSPDVTHLMTLCTLGGHSMSSHVTRAAHKLAAEVGVGPECSEDWQWRTQLTLIDKQATREHLAWLISLAVLEDLAKNSTVRYWPAEVVAYMDHLISRGYELGEWEQTKLDAARMQLDQTNHHLEETS